MIVTSYDNLDMPIKALIDASTEVRERSYSPYSRFKVGAAVRSPKGHIYTGCNIENISYGLSICAEKAAICQAVSLGETKLTEIAVAAVSSTSDVLVSPCGGCRQFLTEFNNSFTIYLFDPCTKKVGIVKIKELLPGSFSSLNFVHPAQKQINEQD